MDDAVRPATPAHLVATVAFQVRRLRGQRGCSLAELAASAGVAKSTIAQLESGQANPSIETLWAVARALEVPFGRLIDPGEAGVRVVRAGEGTRVEAADASFRARLLVTDSRRGGCELYVLDADPGRPRHADRHVAGAVEHVLVLSGRLRAGPAAESVVLEPGDLVTFEGDHDHVYEALEPTTRAVVLMTYG